jgi:uncharacterized membrane protein
MPILTLLLIVLVLSLVVSQRKLSGRVASLEKELSDVRARLLSGSVPAATDAVSPETVLADIRTEDAVDVPAGEPSRTDVLKEITASEETTISHADEPSPAPPRAPRFRRENLESYLGARWPVWVGGVALAFGGIFLVRYSIEAGLLGPGARLSLAAIFGLLLIAAGELVRRRAMPKISELYANAMIPGALTAAGSITLLGAVFAAYAFYDFIGPGTAFVLMALISFATIGLSLLHGQTLAGLGLLGSLITPLLVTTDDPDVNALFLFLGVSWLAVNAASRIRRWSVVPMIANFGIGLWVLAYTSQSLPIEMMPPTLVLLVMIAGTILLWPGRDYAHSATESFGWRELLKRPPLRITLSLSVTVALSALVMLVATPGGSFHPLFVFVALIGALAAVGGSRRYGVWTVVIAGVAALIAIATVASTLLAYVMPEPAIGTTAPVVAAFGHEIAGFLVLGGIFTLLGAGFLRRFRSEEPQFSVLWSFVMWAMPVTIGFISFLNFGNFVRDWTHGLYGIGIGLAMLAVAEWLFRGRDESDGIDWPANIAVLGSFAGITLALHALTNGIVTTILLSVLGFAYLMAMRMRTWPALPWMMAAAIAVVFGRIAWQPTLVGADSLGTTPFFNALLPGYGVPTLLAIVAAWMLRNSTDFRVRNVLQGLASLAALLTLAVLVRHAMNGGVLDARTPTLGEQSIYTLLTIGFSGILMTLDLKSPSPVFRYGSMIAGAIATANVLSAHVFALNPFFSGESTGTWPVLNLLLLGYLLPALAYGLTAYLARGRRPAPYVAMLAVSGALLGFLWATLSVRRFFQGQNIAEWKGFLASETYTYSVVWLLIGIGLLVAGSRWNVRSLRLASAVLVLMSVAKVFLIDMSNLEGIMRALSFIGLGAVLIGIGLFYQRILVNKNDAADTVDSQQPS